MVLAFTTMLDNNKPPELPPKKTPDEEDSDEEEKRFKLTKMIEIMLRTGAKVADIVLNLSHSAIATTNIADLVNQITAGNAQSSCSSSNQAISVHSSPPITVNSSSSESPDEIPAPTEDEEEAEEE